MPKAKTAPSTPKPSTKRAPAKQPRAPKPDHVVALELLSFIHTDPVKARGADFWRVPALDNIAMEWALGAALGAEALNYIRRYEAPEVRNGGGEPRLLVMVFGAMVRKGTFGAVEQGFCRALSNALIGRA